MAQDPPSPTKPSSKPSSPPPAYTELPDAASSSHAPPAPALRSTTSPPPHAGYGPTPIAPPTQLLPYYDPRSPYALETSVPGVFAAGDVRLDSMKRVASAVGEGAMSVYLVHRYLATI